MDQAEPTRHGTPSLLRDLNHARVLASLRRHGPLSRAALARRTGMSKVTSSSVVADLLQAGVLHETERVGGGTGRRPVLLDFAPNVGVVAAADIDAELACLRLADLRGRTQSERTIAVPTDATPNGTEVLAERLATAARELRAETAPGVPLLHLSVAVPASVSDGQELSFAGHPRYLQGATLHRALRRHLEKVGVTLVNDTNAGALGEARHGAARSWLHFAFVGVRRSGIGMGLMLDGAIYPGAHGWAGEVGMLRAGGADAASAAATIEDLDAFNELARVLATSFVLLDLEALVIQLERKETFDWLAEIRRHMAALVPYPVAIVRSELAGKAPLIGALELALEDAWRTIEAQASAARTHTR